MDKCELSPYMRCVICYKDISDVRVLHYAVSVDCLDSFVSMIKDTFVSPDVNFTDLLYSYDTREFFQLI
jgi:hypothetical protein